MSEVLALLQTASLVFWDFDGVIKDSIAVKGDGFEQLFLRYGQDVARRVRQHHEAHGGLSRYEKIPIYLGWAAEVATRETIQEFCRQFSRLVRQGVIDAPWVPGVREYLQAHHGRQRFVLLTATPQEEIQEILQALGISQCFLEVHGAPTPKATAIRSVLRRLRCPLAQALVVGDSRSDLDAAEENRLVCLLRRTAWNHDLQKRYEAPCFDHLDFARVGDS
jgi:phosphoglycolate phosphatase-like HAD superfamily hydrolase